MQELESLSNSDVVTKYKVAAKIVNGALEAGVAARSVPASREPGREHDPSRDHPAGERMEKQSVSAFVYLIYVIWYFCDCWVTQKHRKLTPSHSPSAADALAKVVAAAKPGVKIADLCILGDKIIEECVDAGAPYDDPEASLAGPLARWASGSVKGVQVAEAMEGAVRRGRGRLRGSGDARTREGRRGQGKAGEERRGEGGRGRARVGVERPNMF